MRNFFIIFCFTVQFQIATAQLSRERFNFQGVARDAVGKTIVNSNVSLRLSIHLFQGPVVYRETHQVVTSDAGIFTVLVGTGQVVTGAFSSIIWETGNYLLQVELDPQGGTGYADLGQTQIVSVPYANHASQSDRWKNSDPIIQTGEVGVGNSLPAVGEGSRLIWYPKKFAFLAGFNDGGVWQDSNIGQGSVSFGTSIAKGTFAIAAGYSSTATGENSLAVGKSVQAKGDFSVAIGNNSTAKEASSIALGEDAKADGKYSFAAGLKTWAVGESSVSLGQNISTKTYASVVMGAYNNVQDNSNGPTKAFASPTDRIFQIGNGTSDITLSNALTILRNGNIGLGNNALAPAFILDIGGRARIRHKPNFSAGLWFDDSNETPAAFVGMKTNDEVGFYNGNTWNFWVRSDGFCVTPHGTLQVSDRRLKRDFSILNNSLTKLAKIAGYNYFMIDKKTDQSLQTGVIAQEVEEIFPELVKTDKEGMKSVNYTGFIPHLIESVKELKAENEELKKSVKRIESLEASLNSLIEAKKILSVKVEQSK